MQAHLLLSSTYAVLAPGEEPKVSLNAILWTAGIIAEAAVVGLLIYRRLWRTLPFFFVYNLWTLIGGAAGYAIMNLYPNAYLNTYLVETGVDSALVFCVLVELSWSIVRPFRTSLPRHTIWGLGILVAVAALAIWPFSDSSAFASYPLQWHLLVRLQQTVSILRILFFLLLAASSQLLSIGWRDRELQVATGLGFYSIVGLTTTVLQTHMAAGDLYRRLDQVLVASFVCSSLYWVFCFAQKEAERREFSPQMQSMLLAVAGAARSTRMALGDSHDSDHHRR
jgi:hypothetical protein